MDNIDYNKLKEIVGTSKDKSITLIYDDIVIKNYTTSDRDVNKAKAISMLKSTLKHR